MGNIGSSTSNRRRNGNRNRNSSNTPSAPSPSPEIHGNRYVFAAATPYPPQSQNPNPNPNPNHGPVPYPNPHQFYQYANYYHPPPMMPLPGAEVMHVNWPGRLPCGPVPHVPAPYVEHQKAVTIRNDVNLKKETLRVEPDEQNPGRFLVSFTFDATVAGSISVIFFAKEGEDCNLTPTKPCELPPITISFKQGLGQKFRQPSGTGIDFSMFDEAELLKEGADMEVLPLAVKAEATPALENNGSPENTMAGSINSQITQAVFEKKESGEYHVRVLKQILWVTGMRYELQEIYGIGNSVESDFDGSAQGKECVICLSEQSDTTVLPCRHMCMCSGCAKLLRFQTNRCPICRQPVERLLEIKVNKVEE